MEAQLLSDLTAPFSRPKNSSKTCAPQGASSILILDLLKKIDTYHGNFADFRGQENIYVNDIDFALRHYPNVKFFQGFLQMPI